MTKIIMNKEMPLSVEWMPQNVYMHNSLDHLLPGDRNQDYLIIKSEAEFFQSTLNSQSDQDKVVPLQVPLSPKEDKEIKEQSSCSDVLAPVSFDLSFYPCSKKLGNTARALRLHV
jgi:hypothetical protein